MRGIAGEPWIYTAAMDRVVARLSGGSDVGYLDIMHLENYVAALAMLARGANLRNDGSFGSVGDSQGTADLDEGALSVAAGWFESFADAIDDGPPEDPEERAAMKFPITMPPLDTNYLCLYTNCDTATFYGGERA